MRWLLILVCILIAVAILFGFFYLWEENNSEYTGDASDIENLLEYGGKKYERRKDVEAVLIAGIDKYGEPIDEDSYNNDRQADFLMLMIIDHSEKKISAVHINRDTMAEISVLGIGGTKVGTVRQQLALAHTYGNGGTESGKNVARAVSNLLDVSINHYAMLTMDAVGALTDLVGGVEVEVLDDFTNVDPTLIKGETVTLRGEHALVYVRARAGLEDSTNVHRMERQRQFMLALYEKTLDTMSNDKSFAERSVTLSII